MKHKAILPLGLVLLAVSAACGSEVDLNPNIEATVAARVAEERAKAADAAVIVMIEATVQAVLIAAQNHIVFESYRNGNLEVYVMNADGSGQTNLTNNPANDSHPSWSPDGSRIVFYSNRDGKSGARESAQSSAGPFSSARISSTPRTAR